MKPGIGTRFSESGKTISTVKPLITKTSEEFIKCRLDNFSISYILYYVNFSICENKLIAMNMRQQFKEFQIIILLKD